MKLSQSSIWLLSVLMSIGLLVLFLCRANDIATGDDFRQNLDLPYNARGDPQEDEEDAPEVVIFYGETFRSDCFVWCVDTSSSMGDGELDIAKREVSRALDGLSEGSEFGLVFFNHTAETFPISKHPAVANLASKAEARIYLEGIKAKSNTCPIAGLDDAFSLTQASTKVRRTIIYLSDGDCSCGELPQTYRVKALAFVSTRNVDRTPINTIGIMNPNLASECWLRQVAEVTGGRYARITH